MNYQDIVNYLVGEAGYSPKQVRSMSDKEKFNAALKYEGIIGYTDWILDRVAALNLI